MQAGLPWLLQCLSNSYTSSILSKHVGAVPCVRQGHNLHMDELDPHSAWRALGCSWDKLVALSWRRGSGVGAIWPTERSGEGCAAHRQVGGAQSLKGQCQAGSRDASPAAPHLGAGQI